MSLQLVIDSRERYLIGLLASQSIPHLVETLPLGDILIRIGDQIGAIFERKTWSDLESSQRDGRWREQQSRLAEAKKSGIWVGYIIEGGGASIDQERLIGSLLGLKFRWDLQVIETNNLNDTVALLRRICSKWLEWASSRTESVADWSGGKKSSIGGSEGLVAMLSVIPGVSSTIARVIVASYPSMSLLVDQLRTPMGVANLANLRRGERRIGDVVANRIKEYLIAAPPVAPIAAPIVEPIPSSLLVTLPSIAALPKYPQTPYK